MSAVEVLSELGGPVPPEAVLDALKAAGYAVVELRQPNADGHWSIRCKNDLRVEDGMVMQHLPKSSGMTMSETSPHITRLVAGALLAAADAAEEEPSTPPASPST